ncbi:MAG: DMT family transporter [Gemmatimonadaceae bacterium]
MSRYPILRATALIVVSACCFGSLTTLTLLVMRQGLPLLDVVFWRFFLAAVILFAMTQRTQRRTSSSKAAWRLVAIGGIAQAAISYLSFKALDYLPVGELAFLFYTYPAWVAGISAARGRERLTRPRLIALAIAMAGIAVMVGTPAKSTSNIGVTMALGTAFLYALYLPMINDAQGQLPPTLSSFYLISGIAASFLVVSLAVRQFAIPSGINVWAILLLLAVVGTVMAFGTLLAGLRVLGPVRTSIISTIEPFFTAMLGAVILGQALTFSIIVGGAMIAVAVIVLEYSNEPIGSVSSAVT